MATEHTYWLLERPALMTEANWEKTITELSKHWDTSPKDPQPARRLHPAGGRRNLMNTAVLFEGVVDTADLVTSDTDKFAKYVADTDAVLSPVAAATMFDKKLTQFTAVTWSGSGDKARAYLAKNAAAWESVDEDVITP